MSQVGSLYLYNEVADQETVQCVERMVGGPGNRPGLDLPSFPVVPGAAAAPHLQAPLERRYRCPLAPCSLNFLRHQGHWCHMEPHKEKKRVLLLLK